MVWQLHDVIIEKNCSDESLRFVSGECFVMLETNTLDMLWQRRQQQLQQTSVAA